MPGKDTILNFEPKYSQIIINAPQKTKYRLRVKRSFLRKLGFLREYRSDTYPLGMSEPEGRQINDTFVWLMFTEDKKHAFSLTLLGKQALEHLLEA